MKGEPGDPFNKESESEEEESPAEKYKRMRKETGLDKAALSKEEAESLAVKYGKRDTSK